MKIKNVSCTQFAGVRDVGVSFTDGINVVFGKNESGKSTLVNLLSRTLFQDAKLDKRSNKEFFELYFPGAKKGSKVTGDFADGKVSIETEKGTFILSKEWGDDSRCTLSTPDGVIRDQGKIASILGEVLTYGEGVYSDMLFSSQKNTDVSLQTILDASKKTEAKQEIINAVSQAFAESDGISIDAIEQAINEKTEDLSEHWDVEREMPVRKAGGGRHLRKVGKVLESYYALEDAKGILEEISRLEKEADRTASDYAAKTAEAEKAEEAFNRFSTFASSISVISERKKAIKRIEDDLKKIQKVLYEWPLLEEKLEKAKALKKEKENREILDKFNKAKVLNDEIILLNKESEGLSCPTDLEISKVKTALKNISALENKLCGMNITALINMFGGNKVKITSFRTGDELDTSNGNVSITEAVKISIEGVMEMDLAPANVDVSSIEKQIGENNETIQDIFSKHKVNSTEALEKLSKIITDAQTKTETAKNRLALLLGTMTFEEIEAEANAITGIVRSEEEIIRDILDTCQTSDVSKYVTSKETVMKGYVSEYGSIHEIKAKAFDLSEELKKTQSLLSNAEDIPEEYASVTDPDSYLETLRSALKSAQGFREEALAKKTAALSKLETYKETLADDPFYTFDKATRCFNEQKALLSHWLNIKKVFIALKEDIPHNPTEDIAEKFSHYLNVISGGKVSTEFPDADKLNVTVYSDNRLLDYGKLSEGTKETVSLAFRLAVLDHLFPEGGGVIVFDDPFTDMDIERMERSCALLEECAKRHQVIFLTCREEYIHLLKGNTIRF